MALAVIRAAFAAQSAATDPPSGALSETVESIAASEGACTEQGGAIVAALLWRGEQGGLYLGRLAVLPSARRRGLARALIGAAEQEARRRSLGCLRLGTRVELIGNHRLFIACGFRETGRRAHPGYAAPTSIDFEKPLHGLDERPSGPARTVLS